MSFLYAHPRPDLMPFAKKERKRRWGEIGVGKTRASRVINSDPLRIGPLSATWEGTAKPIGIVEMRERQNQNDQVQKYIYTQILRD